MNPSGVTGHANSFGTLMCCYCRFLLEVSTRRLWFGPSLCCFMLILMTGCQVASRGSVPGPQDPDAPEQFTSTPSGLQYRILRKGDGNFPSATSFVTVDYQGVLNESGREFDSSYGSREPAKFNLSSVVPGWTEGMQLVSVGGMIELIVPPSLGYGAAGIPGTIPPNATLRFVVELRDVRGG
ncbi:MAG: FKBP-type peptidyl-prolyl cis-trans isomerase [Planctomycetota bacterium]